MKPDIYKYIKHNDDTLSAEFWQKREGGKGLRELAEEKEKVKEQRTKRKRKRKRRIGRVDGEGKKERRGKRTWRRRSGRGCLPEVK
ncbi:hypothetical protein B296_00013640 [Ensete ventricosum]|uniref:Uncharacterized protein n=1 Tax=Ensete ventricosum TaxID=4639 RepID=A0A427AD58_ENSVE|nr:hypothetical protein B296_00013640 [Ensete ventricosum]